MLFRAVSLSEENQIPAILLIFEDNVYPYKSGDNRTHTD